MQKDINWEAKVMVHDMLMVTPYPLNPSEGIGRRFHDLALANKGADAGRDDIVGWMCTEMRMNPAFHMTELVERATGLIGEEHGLVSMLGPFFVQTKTDMKLAEKGADAGRDDIAKWMESTIRMSESPDLAEIVERATGLIGEEHGLVSMLGKMFAEAKDKIART